ncbi:hypothetical protein CQW23_27345 [Capsicum baccatum]|uniref:DUF506 family protein n=1 Tax=Capsicum baccatum TaxID=33114 RepID=A0A2G2VDJ6_CAPBA|nr:hypothetical protein CQW23_27345 [Capsicum baccatum]
MARFVPMKFKRVTEAFDEVAKARICESSGSEHSPASESVMNLSELVNSFLEGEVIVDDKLTEITDVNVDDNNNNCFDESKIKENLKDLFDCDDGSKRRIINAVKNALDDEEENERSSIEFKRRLMSRLRDRGFDVGLCKSKWEKASNHTSGSYEYIDVNMLSNRYIIEVSLAGEFEIARPTRCYAKLLDIFPNVFVGKVEELKQVVRIMSRAMKKSMKKMDIYVPPWRRLGYMEAKWFGSYKRTTNENYQKINFDLMKKRDVGFVPIIRSSEREVKILVDRDPVKTSFEEWVRPDRFSRAIAEGSNTTTWIWNLHADAHDFDSHHTRVFNCRGNIVASNSGIKIGNLAAALNG